MSPGFDSSLPLTEHPDAPAFAAELQDEHFDAIGFLLGHRWAWAEDADVGWRQAIEVERRIEAHRQAVVVGGAPARARAVARLQAEEPETALGALHVLAAAEVAETGFADALAAWDPERRLAAVDVLVYRCTPGVLDALLGAEAAGARAIGTATCARSASGDVARLEQLLADPEMEVRSRAAFALAALARKGIASRIEVLLAQDHDHLETAAHAFLLSLGDGGRDVLWRVAQRSPSALLAVARPLALIGDGRIAEPLERTLDDNPPPAAMLALGILGHPASVDALLRLVDSQVAPEPALAAAEALVTITGLQVPADHDGEPVALDPGPWQAWRDRHAKDQARVRHRHGVPLTKAAALDELNAPAAPRGARTRAGAELALRLGPAGFDPAACVASQERALATWTGRATPGRGAAR